LFRFVFVFCVSFANLLPPQRYYLPLFLVDYFEPSSVTLIWGAYFGRAETCLRKFTHIMAQCIEISIASFALATLWKSENNFSLQLSAHMRFWLVITCVQIYREEPLTNLLMTKLNCTV
jgi:hypothetical protein